MQVPSLFTTAEDVLYVLEICPKCNNDPISHPPPLVLHTITKNPFSWDIPTTVEEKISWLGFKKSRKGPTTNHYITFWTWIKLLLPSSIYI